MPMLARNTHTHTHTQAHSHRGTHTQERPHVHLNSASRRKTQMPMFARNSPPGVASSPSRRMEASEEGSGFSSNLSTLPAQARRKGGERERGDA